MHVFLALIASINSATKPRYQQTTAEIEHACKK